MSFPLVGNVRLREAVEGAVSSGRIPHALLIEGDVGTGRHTLALYLAQAAVCSEQSKPCGECRNCHLVQVGTHPDVSFITPDEGKKNITVDKIRELRQQAYIKPHMADRRVFLIDRADIMNEQAQNALLKVLEEPPAGVIFLLIAESRTTLLDTIVSRCVVLTVSVPEHDDALQYLHSVSKKNNDEISVALEAAGNNIGKALATLSKKKQSAVTAAAEELLRLVFCGSEFEMLSTLAPFEKDRVAADELFHALKTGISEQLRQCYRDTAKARVLTALYEQIFDYETLLKTNINLSLLFGAAVCKINRLKNINL